SRQRTGQRSEARGWLVVAVTVMLAVVPTHHLTSYVMMLVLAVMSLRGIRLPGRVPTLKLGKARPVWPLAVLAFVVIGAWLMFVASQTVGYLSPAIQAALVSTLKTLTGATQAHAPFSGQHTYGGANASNTPGEIIIALLEPVLLVSAAALGWRKAWRGPDSEKMLVVFVLGALAFCAATAARVFPNVWQIADRGAEYLFVGVAYLIGSLRLGYHRVIWGRRAGRAGVALVAAMCVIGGVITAWPAASRNAQPTQITVGGRTIYSERLALARWSASLPPGLFAAIEADSLYLQADGKRQMINGLGSGYLVGNEAVLAGTDWTARDAASFRRQHVRYVVLDRSPAARDWVQGMYLQLAPPTGLAFHLGPRSVLTKLDAHAARVYDSGDIAVYDLAGRP
ncbi:MAG: hypothetical protein J2O48_02295, partial [Solirubrobacterales bacterium]|nr:hypothetical protein [Solirubrobacterales bacterium]